MEDYVVKDHKKLRRGYTTGTCAAAAAAAAAKLLFLRAADAEPDGEDSPGPRAVEIELTTPNGTPLTIEALAVPPQDVPEGAFEASTGSAGLPPGGSISRNTSDRQKDGQSAVCAVKKDSGDDPDVTDGVLVYAKVTLFPDEQGRIRIDGGKGVGRVTKPGLACAVGQAAINPTPRKMIEAEARRAAELAGYEGGISVEIAIPAGEELAKRTYNPRLGIEGGISVLGTSGIVEPMSEQALIDTIKVEMNIRRAAGAQYILLTPGNYGETFLKETMGLGGIYTVKCSNFLGEALDYAVELGFKGLLLTAHIGKLVKVAGGIMNTHSKYGDARMEILAAHAARLGAGREVVEELFRCVTTDDAIAVLDQAADGGTQLGSETGCELGRETNSETDGGPGPDHPSELRIQTIHSILQRIEYHIEERTRGTMKTGAVMFSNKFGYLGQTAGADELVRRLRNNE